jgi:hypothetical protein
MKSQQERELLHKMIDDFTAHAREGREALRLLNEALADLKKRIPGADAKVHEAIKKIEAL